MKEPSISPSISLVMIVKNEEHFLKKCLESVSGVATEMIIVDTGSTDKTKEIARSFNAKIFDLEWKDDFASARNFALKQATCDWILHLDADEELMPADAPLVKKLTADDSIYVYMTEIIDTEISEIFPSMRLFRNGKGFAYAGAIHENIEASLHELNNEHLAYSGIRIIHKGYGSDIVSAKDKQARNLNLLKKIEDEDPTNEKNLMDLAVQYHSMKEFKTAINYFQKVIISASGRGGDGPPEAYKYLIQCFEALKDPLSAIAAADQGIARFPFYTDIIFLQGIDLFITQQYDRAINNFRQCLKIDKKMAMPTKIPGSQGILSELFLNLAIYETTHDNRIFKTLDKLMIDLSKSIDALFFLGKHYKNMFGEEHAIQEISKIADQNDPEVKKIMEMLFTK